MPREFSWRGMEGGGVCNLEYRIFIHFFNLPTRGLIYFNSVLLLQACHRKRGKRPFQTPTLEGRADQKKMEIQPVRPSMRPSDEVVKGRLTLKSDCKRRGTLDMTKGTMQQLWIFKNNKRHRHQPAKRTRQTACFSNMKSNGKRILRGISRHCLVNSPHEKISGQS